MLNAQGANHLSHWKSVATTRPMEGADGNGLSSFTSGVERLDAAPTSAAFGTSCNGEGSNGTVGNSIRGGVTLKLGLEVNPSISDPRAGAWGVGDRSPESAFALGISVASIGSVSSR